MVVGVVEMCFSDGDGEVMLSTFKCDVVSVMRPKALEVKGDAAEVQEGGEVGTEEGTGVRL